jgi:NAD(P)-dependent dehydrogenase (short-subunit alcohol dehydrogenase family)
MFRLDGKRAIVTGGGSGIGRAICDTFAKQGAAVACLDVDENGARDTVATIEAGGGRAFALCADVTDKAAVEAATAAAVARFGGAPDILVNFGRIVAAGGTVCFGPHHSRAGRGLRPGAVPPRVPGHTGLARLPSEGLGLMASTLCRQPFTYDIFDAILPSRTANTSTPRRCHGWPSRSFR